MADTLRISRRNVLQSAACGAVLASSPLLAQQEVGDGEAKDKLEAKRQKAMENGLAFLVGEQKEDGSWQRETYTVSLTALAGLALLGTGSTTTQGKYAKQLRKAVDFLLSTADDRGLMAEKDVNRYMFGHAYALWFLSQVDATRPGADLQKKIQAAIDKGLKFITTAQTKHGGWGYIAAAESKDHTESAATATLLHAVGMCHRVGIKVPDKTIDKGIEFLRKGQNPDGGLQYSHLGKEKQSRPAISTVAWAALFALERTKNALLHETGQVL